MCSATGNGSLTAAVLAAVPDPDELGIEGGLAWATWGLLSFEFNLQAPRSPLGRDARRAWKAEEARLAHIVH